MANWYGTARTNYVRVADEEGLKKSIAPFGMETSRDSEGRIAFFGNDPDSGDFPSMAYQEPGEGETEETEVEFDWADRVVGFLVPGEVLVVQTVGAEKLRYVTGYAQAYQLSLDGQEVHDVDLNIDLIYELAAKKFGVDQQSITIASF